MVGKFVICDNCANNDETCSLCDDCKSGNNFEKKSDIAGLVSGLAPRPWFSVPEITKGVQPEVIKEAPKNNMNIDKPDMSLIPMDLLSEFLEPAYREGLAEYSRDSWREGFKISTMIGALRRHEAAFYHDGEDLDPEAVARGVNKHHLGAMLFCVLCMCDTVKNHPHMDDRIKHVDTL